ncbi:hypothetical protein AAT19DRAFT_13163 [Rhodotorula toruloides]|uniref:Uncharacterized protein n=1 Tax=Rhodotorula toruloides TaxID=5286 RepID=A0A2T0ADR0_RHOTO|nr:hypothetical protein AAT19DRAFT_13163 [Rhodotorula toruloides]
MPSLDSLPVPLLLELASYFKKPEELFLHGSERFTLGRYTLARRPTDDLVALSSVNKRLREVLLEKVFGFVSIGELDNMPECTKEYQKKVEWLAEKGQAVLRSIKYLEIAPLLPKGLRALAKCVKVRLSRPFDVLLRLTFPTSPCRACTTSSTSSTSPSTLSRRSSSSLSRRSTSSARSTSMSMASSPSRTFCRSPTSSPISRSMPTLRTPCRPKASRSARSPSVSPGAVAGRGTSRTAQPGRNRQTLSSTAWRPISSKRTTISRCFAFTLATSRQSGTRPSGTPLLRRTGSSASSTRSPLKALVVRRSHVSSAFASTRRC